MTTALSNRLRAGGFIQSEANFARSRDRVAMSSGFGVLPAGLVLAKVRATGYFVPCVASASDGSNVAIGVLFEQVDTDAPGWNQIAVALVRDAEVRAADLSYDASISTLDQQQQIWALLAACGIEVRTDGWPIAVA